MFFLLTFFLPLLCLRSDLRIRHQRDTGLIAAVKAGDVARAEALLVRGANIETRFRSGLGESDPKLWMEDDLTPLALAVNRKNRAMIQMLVARGTDVNARRGNGEERPPQDVVFCTAARNGDRTVVRLLLGKGAEVNSDCGMGTSPLMLAVGHHQRETVTLLIHEGADVSLRDDRGFSVLHFVKGRHNDHSDIARLLRGAGAK